MDPDLHEDLLAELSALNTAVIKALSAAVALAEQEGIPRALYLERLLLSGEETIANAEYWSIPEERRGTLIEKARVRYSEIIDAVHLQQTK